MERLIICLTWGHHLSPLHPNFKQAVLDSDRHDTVLTEIPDIARGNVWPGAMSRVRRNALVERWAGRESELCARQPEAAAALERARETGDVDNATLFIGQDAGLIDDIPPAGEIVERIVAEAEALLGTPCPTTVSISASQLATALPAGSTDALTPSSPRAVRHV